MNLSSQRSQDQSLITPVIVFTVFFLRLSSFAFVDIMLSWACLTGSPSLSCASSQSSWPSLPPGPEGLSLSVANYPVSGCRYHQCRHDSQPSLQQPQSLSWSQSDWGPERWDLLSHSRWFLQSVCFWSPFCVGTHSLSNLGKRVHFGQKEMKLYSSSRIWLSSSFQSLIT